MDLREQREKGEEKERRSWHNDEGINRQEGLKIEEETGL